MAGICRDAENVHVKLTNNENAVAKRKAIPFPTAGDAPDTSIRSVATQM
jgi:hypothetical protein